MIPLWPIMLVIMLFAATIVVCGVTLFLPGTGRRGHWGPIGIAQLCALALVIAGFLSLLLIAAVYS